MAHVVIDQGGVQALRSHVAGRFEKVPHAQLADARRMAPVLTGALASSGGVEQLGFTSWRIHFGRGLPDGRAVFNELGTVKMAAQPYIRPAMYRARAV